MRPHVAPNLLDEPQRAGDIGIDHAADVIEVLIQERPAEPPSRIRQQGVHRAPLRRPVEARHALVGSQVGLHGAHVRPHEAE